MAERYKWTLSADTLKKAVIELNEPEDNALRLAAIDRLHKRFQDETKNMKLIRSDDSFLIRFLRVRKYDEDRAFETLKNYHTRREESREIFDLVDNPKSIENFIRSGAASALREGRAKDGTFVVLARMCHGYQDSGDFVKLIALLVLTMEKLLENEEFQIYGVTVINDVSELGISYVPFMATYSWTLMHIVQEAMPVRTKAVHLVNESGIIDFIYSIITKFMKEKLKNRLMMHGTEFKKLHDKVDPKYLPFCLGGSGPDVNGDWWAHQLITAVGAGEDTAL